MSIYIVFLHCHSSLKAMALWQNITLCINTVFAFTRASASLWLLIPATAAAAAHLGSVDVLVFMLETTAAVAVTAQVSERSFYCLSLYCYSALTFLACLGSHSQANLALAVLRRSLKNETQAEIVEPSSLSFRLHIGAKVRLTNPLCPIFFQHISSRRHKDRAAGKPAKPKYSPYSKPQKGQTKQPVSHCTPHSPHQPQRASVDTTITVTQSW